MDIFEQLGINQMDCVQKFQTDFQGEPVPQESVPVSQRVQAFLTDIFGAVWASCGVFSFVLPDGQSAHLAFAPTIHGLGVRMVAERLGGSLTLAAPVPAEETAMVFEMASQPSVDEYDIDDIGQTLAALIEAAEAVRQAKKLAKHDRKRIRHEIAHACMLLSDLGISQNGY